MKGKTVKRRLLKCMDELEKEHKDAKKLERKIQRKVDEQIKEKEVEDNEEKVEDDEEETENDEEKEEKSVVSIVKNFLWAGCVSIIAYELVMLMCPTFSEPSPVMSTNLRPLPTMSTNDTIEMLERSIRRPSSEVRKRSNTMAKMVGLGWGIGFMASKLH